VQRLRPHLSVRLFRDRGEAARGLAQDAFDLDFSTCSLCGLCIDVCPTNTLQYSRRYDDAAYQRMQTVNDLLAPFGEDPYLSGKLK
jgi:NADH-quinone oxidoreductase subunit I